MIPKKYITIINDILKGAFCGHIFEKLFYLPANPYSLYYDFCCGHK